MNETTPLQQGGSIGDILLADPERFGPILAFAQDVMRGSGSFAAPDRELLAAYVSALNACTFCHGVHTAVAERFGADAKVLAALVADEASSDLDNNLRPIFDFARKLTLTPSRVTDEDRQSITAAGHSPDVVAHVIAIVALFSFFNRLVDGHGVKGSADIYARDSEMLFAFGYMPPAQ